MSRQSAVKGFRRAVHKVDHKGRMKTHIPAQMAAAGPPLGTQLGAIGINIANFCKDFNLKTSIYKPGTPIPCRVYVNPDRTYKLFMDHPPVEHFIKQASGCTRGIMNQGEVSGMMTRKHVYEIAKLKSTDEFWDQEDLEVICKYIIKKCGNIGIKIVDKLDPEEYGKFLIEREKVNKEQRAEIEAEREAKLLRT